jgi:hypothetical protein
MKTEETNVLKDLMTRYTSAAVLEEVAKYCEDQSKTTQGLESATWLKWSVFARTESVNSDDWGGSVKAEDVDSLRDLIVTFTPEAVLGEIAELVGSAVCNNKIALQD